MESSSAASEKLREQNNKLRDQLDELSGALQDAVKRHKKQEQDKRRVPIQKNDLQNSKERELRKLQAQIKEHKRDIEEMRKSFSGSLGGHDYTGLENQKADLERQMRELTAEQKVLDRVEADQLEAIDAAANSQGYPEKIRQLGEKIRNMKLEYKEIDAQLKKDFLLLQTTSSNVMTLELACRKMQERIAKHAMKQKAKAPSTAPTPDSSIPNTQAELDEFKRKCAEAEGQALQEHKQLTNRLKMLTGERDQRKEEADHTQLTLKEKDKEIRLNALKLKEMRKVIRHHQLRPLPPLVAKKEQPGKNDKKGAKKTFVTSEQQMEEDVYMKKSYAQKTDSAGESSEGSDDYKGLQSDEEDYGDQDYGSEGSDYDT